MNRLRQLLVILATLALGALGGHFLWKAPATEPTTTWIDISTDSGKRIPLKTVMTQTSGTRVIPLDSGNPAHQEISKAVTKISGLVSKELSQEGSPAHEKRRINEVSALFENALKSRLDALPDFSCQIPPTSTGKQQRSGYPDLRVEHLPTQTVAYLDPKLFQHDSQQSSLRTFYYEATSENTKVTEDALHLLLGFPHDGNNGQWKFGKAKLVDLSALSLKLKVEFSASNKDLYSQ
ncbi:MAG: hypothetical protein P8P32_15305 [Akkermansiaceae bacterium]|nr:hypothetical protein [Akkermansiaceae bacterium]